MKTYSFEKVACPKCGKVYAVAKGMATPFHCPGKNCHELVNQRKEEAKRENVQR